MSATHPISPSGGLESSPDEPGAMEGAVVEHSRYYPTRRDSLSFYADRLVPVLWRLVLRVVATLGGIAVAALGVLALGLSDAGPGVILGPPAVALGGWLLLLTMGFGGASRDHLPSWRLVIDILMSFVAGLLLSLAGWRLAPERYVENLALTGILIGGGVVVALALRAAGPRAWRAKRERRLIYASQTIAALSLVLAFAPPGARPAIAATVLVALLIAAVPGANLGLRWLLRKRVDLKPLSLAIGFLLTAAAIAIAVPIVAVWNAERTVATVLATGAVLVFAPLGVDYARRLAPGRHAYKALLLAFVVAVAVLLWRAGVYGTWVPTAAAAAVVVLAIAVVAVGAAHLAFLGAFGLLRHLNTPPGLEASEAGQALAWQDGRMPPPANAHVRRVANLVHPGAGHPNGPLQRWVSEVFDSDEPPFHKSFLRLDLTSQSLRVRCYGVTGKGGDEYQELVEDCSIPLDRSVPERSEGRSTRREEGNDPSCAPPSPSP